MATPYEPDGAFSADSDGAVAERQLSEKVGVAPLYRWTYFSLIEGNVRRDVYDLGAWWLALTQPSVRLAPRLSGGIVMQYRDAARGEDPGTMEHYATYPVPIDDFVTDTAFEIMTADGVVYATNGSEIVCDGQLHLTPINTSSQTYVSPPQTYVSPSPSIALTYSCTTLQGVSPVGSCQACRKLDTSAGLCDRLLFGTSF